jgi:hypothetical protein
MIKGPGNHTSLGLSARLWASYFLFCTYFNIYKMVKLGYSNKQPQNLRDWQRPEFIICSSHTSIMSWLWLSSTWYCFCGTGWHSSLCLGPCQSCGREKRSRQDQSHEALPLYLSWFFLSPNQFRVPVTQNWGKCGKDRTLVKCFTKFPWHNSECKGTRGPYEELETCNTVNLGSIRLPDRLWTHMYLSFSRKSNAAFLTPLKLQVILM